MNILVIKTSSLGDIIHTLPALTDAARHYPTVSFDWLVEENFAEIPNWHANVAQTIPIAWRHWRKDLKVAWRQQHLQQFYQRLRQKDYDLVIDAQGLLKSAFMSRLSKGLRCGLDFRSAREPFAALFYQRRFPVLFAQHAVVRARQLFAQALDYPCPIGPPDYAIRANFNSANPYSKQEKNTVLFIHGTTWTAKEWPESYWIALGKYCEDAGWQVKIPWGNPTEKARAQRIAASGSAIEVLPKTSLLALANILLHANAAVAVDTGIGHLAAALSVPTISLYGPTDPSHIGTCGNFQTHLRNSNHMMDLSVSEVWQRLKSLVGDEHHYA